MFRPIALTFALCLGGAMPAVAQGVTLSAAGNEPFWRVEIANSTLTLTRPDVAPVVLPVIDDGRDGPIMAADAKAGLRATLALTEAVCRDTMSGMPYPFAAVLTLGDQNFEGCGGDPLDLLADIEWQVTALGDMALVADAPALIRFGRDGRVSGTGGCNRLMGGYSLTEEGVSLGEGVASTMMACPDPIMAQERALFDALSQVTGFDIGPDGALILHGVDGPLLSAMPVAG
jgi:heat shock protein HslJ